MPRIACAVVCLMIVGCTTAGSVRDEPLSAGATRIFRSDYAAAAKAATLSIPDLDLTPISEKRDDGHTILIAQHRYHLLPNSEFVRILIQPYGDGASVRIITKYIGGAMYTDFDEPLFTRIGQRLGEYP